MAAARPRLTAQLRQDLCERIKAGAFEQVAAESLGVPYEIYRTWLARGRGARAGRAYRELYRGVCQARAHARLMAEMDLRTKAPKVWLLNGPGRETGNLPGWTAPAKAGPGGEDDQLDVFAHPEVVALLNRIHQALLPFAEAQTAVLQAVASARPVGPRPAG